jgi:hypothetical protein
MRSAPGAMRAFGEADEPAGAAAGAVAPARGHERLGDLESHAAAEAPTRHAEEI